MGAGGHQRREVLLRRHRLPFERREAVRDGDLSVFTIAA